MKAKVLRDFIDKTTMLPYHDGDIYENEDEASVSFLHKAGYISKAETAVKKADEQPTEPAAGTNDGGKEDAKEDAKGGKGSKGGKKDKAAGEEK